MVISPDHVFQMHPYFMGYQIYMIMDLWQDITADKEKSHSLVLLGYLRILDFVGNNYEQREKFVVRKMAWNV